MNLTRRQVLGGAALTAATGLLGACGGFSHASTLNHSKGTKVLTFTTWASDAEKRGFEKTIAAFERDHRGVKVDMNTVPYGNMFTDLDAQLQADTGPDIFRVDYGTLGLYSSGGQLLDLSPYFDTAARDAFLPAMWQAVLYRGRPYGVPHQTDTSAILYQTQALKDAGVTATPTSLADAWSWEEFDQILSSLRKTLHSDVYPFVCNWQLAGAPRWFTWLFQAGGTFLNEQLDRSTIDSPAGARAIDLTRGWFTKHYVPPNTSVKSGSWAPTVFESGAAAMATLGNFLITEVQDYGKFDWGVTYLPRDQRGADDLGGNALVATRTTPDPDLAAEFLTYMVSTDSMTTYCAESMELPTRQELVGRDLGYAVRPEVMPIFINQATTLTSRDVAQLTVPHTTQINTILQDQLEAAFTGGQSTATTLKHLSQQITKVVA